MTRIATGMILMLSAALSLPSVHPIEAMAKAAEGRTLPPPPWQELGPVRELLVSGPCGGNACTPAETSQLSFTPDGSRVVFGWIPWSDVIQTRPEAPLRVVGWDGPKPDQELQVCIENSGSRFSSALSPTGTRLALGGSGSLRLFEVDASEPFQEPKAMTCARKGAARGLELLAERDRASKDVLSLAWSPDEKSLAAGVYRRDSSKARWQILVIGLEEKAILALWILPKSPGGQPVLNLAVVGWLGPRYLVAACDESPDTDPGRNRVLYLLDFENPGSAPHRFGSLARGEAAFVSRGETFVLDPEGGIRRASEKDPIARIELPPLAHQKARREILNVAAFARSRLAVAFTDRLQISVGEAPCCTRLLLLEEGVLPTRGDQHHPGAR